MPAAPNNILAVEQRLWTIALGWPGLTTGARPILLPGNTARFDQLGIKWPGVTAKSNRQPADQIEFTLDMPGTARPDPRAPRTFCFQPNVKAVEYHWTLVATDQRLNLITQAQAELEAAMMNTDTGAGVAAGVQLGIPTVVARWESEMRPGRTKSPAKERSLIWVQRVYVKG